ARPPVRCPAMAPGAATTRNGRPTGVLHLIASADRRGAEVFGHELADRLAAVGLPGEVLALAPARPGTVGLDVDVLAVRTTSGVQQLRRRAASFDVVIGHGSTGLTGGVAATLGSGRAFVYRSIGDPAAWGATSPARRLRVGAQLRSAAAVVALWEGASATIGTSFRVPAERRAVIPNGAAAHQFPFVEVAQRAAAREELGLGPGPVLAVIGALGPEKRVHLAVGAMAELPDATLLIVGDGPEKAAVSAAAAPFGDRVRLLVGREDITPIYRAADVVVSTSRTEGQSGVLIEARMSGLAVVATDVGGTSSVVDDASGCLVPADASPAVLAAAVREALAVPEAERRAASHRAAATFDLGSVTAAWADLVRQVAARRPLQP
ncbi:MAG: putative glycosyltransferase, partial [Acidimicrobiales bacterium]|nr:putative glycosyltransferase [Acidimicrobiales bacterium]